MTYLCSMSNFTLNDLVIQKLSSILLCSSLGSLSWKSFAEASKNAELYIEVQQKSLQIWINTEYCLNIKMNLSTLSYWNNYNVDGTRLHCKCSFKTFNHDKSLMFKYGRMQNKISPWLVCGSHGTCLDCMLPGVQVTTGLGFFSVLKSFMW